MAFHAVACSCVNGFKNNAFIFFKYINFERGRIDQTTELIEHDITTVLHSNAVA